MVNSQRKGKDFERWVADWFRYHLGTPARRGQQFCGGPESPDVMYAIPGVHIECKATEHLRLYQAMQQARRDAGNNIPIVISKANHKPVLVTVQLEHLIELAVRVFMVLENSDGSSVVSPGQGDLD